MDAISFRESGDFSKLTSFLERIKESVHLGILNRYGAEGVRILSAATPVDSGATAQSWYYKIEQDSGSASINFYNSNMNEGINIAIILQYGHGTGTGGWVEGRDYINPAIQPLFDDLAEAVWEEVINS